MVEAGLDTPDRACGCRRRSSQSPLHVYAATPGNLGAYLVSRPDGDRTEFLTISFWETKEAIAAFAGDDIDQAVFYPEDDRFLIDRETTVKHFTVH